MIWVLVTSTNDAAGRCCNTDRPLPEPWLRGTSDGSVHGPAAGDQVQPERGDRLDPGGPGCPGGPGRVAGGRRGEDQDGPLLLLLPGDGVPVRVGRPGVRPGEGGRRRRDGRR